MDISYHFHKIRLKCEIFSPTFTREKGPMAELSKSVLFNTRTKWPAFVPEKRGKSCIHFLRGRGVGQLLASLGQ